MMVYFEVAHCSIYRDNREKIFPNAEFGGGTSGINAICCRPEVVNVIFGYAVETFRDYHTANLQVASFISFPENLNQPHM